MAFSKYRRRVAGFIFKAICTLIILAIAILLLWRIIDSSNDPKEMNTIIPNKILCDTYTEHGGSLTAFNQVQSKFTRGEENYGYFAITQSLFIREADQLQFVFRYNNSTLEHTAEDYGLSSVPSRDSKVYDVTVSVMYDLTPNDTSDNDGKTPEAVRYERFYPSEEVKAQKTLYNYRKYVFDDIKITDDVIGVYVDIYYCDDIDYEKKPYGSLLIYYYEDENESYRFTKNDKNAIESAINGK